MDFKLEEVVTSCTSEDGVIDWAGVQSKVDNDYVNPIIASKKPNMEKIQNEIQEQLFTGLGIDGISNLDTFNAYAKKMNSNTDETKEALTRIEKERDELLGKFNDVNSKYENTIYENGVLNNGFNPKYKKSVIAEAKSLVSEELDFNKALEKVKTDFPEWLGEVKINKGGKVPPPNEKNNNVPTGSRNWRNWNK